MSHFRLLFRLIFCYWLTSNMNPLLTVIFFVWSSVLLLFPFSRYKSTFNSLDYINNIEKNITLNSNIRLPILPSFLLPLSLYTFISPDFFYLTPRLIVPFPTWSEKSFSCSGPYKSSILSSFIFLPNYPTYRSKNVPSSFLLFLTQPFLYLPNYTIYS